MSDRYARHLHIPDWNQARLTHARVIIVGMGALGNEVARILAMSGVGNLILCDPDQIEESNLSRTLLFRTADIGRLKVEVAKAALLELVPDIQIQTRSRPLVHGIGLAELRDATLILSCLDSRAARLQLAGRCQLVQAPSVDGGTHPWGGEVRPYLEPNGPCYGCSLSEEDRSTIDVPWSCLDISLETIVGAATPSSALVGTWMGMVGLRFLMGLGGPGGTLRIDGGRGTTLLVHQTIDLRCPLHSPLGEVDKINVGSEDTIETLRCTLPPEAVPLLWEPVQERVECGQCGFQEIRWELPKLTTCPQCDATLRPRTTLEISNAPASMRLSQLGIPPREILTIRTASGLHWVELHS